LTVILDDILTTTRRRVDAISSEPAGIVRPRSGHSLAGRLQRPGLQVIAEIKRRSPSRGVIAPGLDVVARATAYAAGDAAAISVLTEPDFFGGSLEDLRRVRAAVDLPILRKDFIIHRVQVAESRAAGADALLLIVAALGPKQTRDLLIECAAIGIEALVEAHDGEEAKIAVDVGAQIVGINNRDLRTFVTDLAVAERVAGSLSGKVVRVAESGVSDEAGARRMAAAGYDAILVGEAAVRADDPAALVAGLMRVGR